MDARMFSATKSIALQIQAAIHYSRLPHQWTFLLFEAQCHRSIFTQILWKHVLRPQFRLDVGTFDERQVKARVLKVSFQTFSRRQILCYSEMLLFDVRIKQNRDNEKREHQYRRNSRFL
jgi:hypothetical protein